MALAVQKIQAAENDEALFNLPSAEWERLVHGSVKEDRDPYYKMLATLPRVLPAMAGIHFFDVSMTLDGLDWHLGNQNDERDLNETLNGLRELKVPEICRYVRTVVGS